MSDLIRRSYALQFALNTSEQGDLIVEDSLDLAFEARLTLKKEPNKAAVQIWNLNEDHRHNAAELSKKIADDKIEGAILSLEAGYKGDRHRIFRGDIMRAESVREEGDIITVISAYDGAEAYKSAQVSKGFEKNTSIEAVIKACAEALKVGIGNAVKTTKGAQIKNIGANFANGTAVYGRASAELDKILEASGFEWSIQGGVLDVRKIGEADQDRVFRLTPDTGLVGSPTYGVENDETGTVKKTKLKRFLSARALLLPGIKPGQKIELESEEHPLATYRMEEITHSGSTFEQNWYSDLKLKAIQ